MAATAGLAQYFNIGSPEKLQKPKSPHFRRDRIGQFGIGKFASLSACERFEVETQKGEFAARVIFDKSAWGQEGEAWRLPREQLRPDPKRGDGTTVTLRRLTRRFELKEVERRLVEGVPLKAPSFHVFLNGWKGFSHTFSRGSRASRRPSPKRLKESTVIRMAKPGVVATCGAMVR